MKLQRTFSPLDKWIYLKIYINPIASNIVINNYLSTILLSLDPLVCEKWFFLRYSDPEYHIRLRLYVPLVKNRKKILYKLRMTIDQGMKDGFIHSWNLDCYVREIERYGESTMLMSEHIFCCDSIYAIRIISKGGFSMNTLNQCSLAMIHDTLNSLGFSLNEKIVFCEDAKNAYAKEMGVSDRSIKILNSKYQKYRLFLDSLENRQWDELFSNELQERSQRLKSILQLNGVDNKGQLNVHALIHLSINRMYEFNARQNEFVLYHILMKHYKSQLFRRIANS